MAEVTSSFKPYVVSISGLGNSDETSWKGVPILRWWHEGSVTLKGRIKVAVQYSTKAGEQISWNEYVIESGQTRTFSNTEGQDMQIYLLETEPVVEEYTCPYCGATFSTQEELNSHIETEHPTEPETPGAFTWNGCKLIWAGEINVDEVLACGFNTALCYLSESRLDECLAKGLWVIGSIKDFFQFPEHYGGEEGGKAAARDFINRWKGHPAIAAWLFLDEPDIHGPYFSSEHQQEWYNFVKSIDPVHPLYTNFMGHITENFNPSAFDHCSFDIYPINTNTPTWDQARVRLHNSLNVCDARRGGTSGMALVQAMGGGPEEMLMPTGHVHGMLRIFQEHGLGRQADGYAMYAWTDGAGAGSIGIAEDSSLFNEVRALNASYNWPHAPPGPVTEYPCPYCGATFSTQAELDAHIASAHPVFTCPYCGATFSSQTDLDAHIATEHPVPVFTCPYCGATFSSQTDLDAHIATEHPVPVFTCPHCGATFSTQTDLDAHIATVHPVPVYTCPHCAATFATQGQLDNHIASEHPIAAEVPWYKKYAPFLAIGAASGVAITYLSLRKRG